MVKKEKIKEILKRIRAMKEKDIVAEIREKEKRLAQLTIKKELDKIKNHSQISNLRKDIARLKTIIRQKIIKSLEENPNKKQK